jgi:predicted metal-dependent enzyme (double-stranded beta helix superfamily)
MLHRSRYFNVTAMVWRPADTAKAHNHEAWGMIGVISDDDIHAMPNPTPRDTVEIHIYGKDLVDLERLRLEAIAQTYRTFCSSKYDNC